MSAFIVTQPQDNLFKSKLMLILNFLARNLTNKESFSAYIESVIQLIKPEWRYKRRSAKVISIKSETKNIYTLTLKPDNKWSGFISGQFVLLSVEIDGRMMTRTFSISSAPRDYLNSGNIEISIRVQDHGHVTNWLKDELKSGDYVYLSEAMGDFCLSSGHHKKVFIAAGSGITPIRSMLNEHTDSAWLKEAHLFFFVRDKNELFFAQDFESLKAKGLNLHITYTQESGHFNLNQLEQALSQNGQNQSIETIDFYVCGPGKMIDSSISILANAGVDRSNIHFEYFGQAPRKLGTPETDKASNSSDFIQVDYLTSRKQVTFNSGTVNKTLLELAEDEGLKPVSGCRMGICHQCICKKKQGRVFNTKTQRYSDSGEEEIQLCLSIPVGSVQLAL